MECNTLKDTIDMMISDDYKERFKAEYYQLRLRSLSLKKLIEKITFDENLDFTPVCPINSLSLQFNIMQDYLAILELRAVAEGIELD